MRYYRNFDSKYYVAARGMPKCVEICSQPPTVTQPLLEDCLEILEDRIECRRSIEKKDPDREIIHRWTAVYFPKTRIETLLRFL